MPVQNAASPPNGVVVVQNAASPPNGVVAVDVVLAPEEVVAVQNINVAENLLTGIIAVSAQENTSGVQDSLENLSAPMEGKPEPTAAWVASIQEKIPSLSAALDTGTSFSSPAHINTTRGTLEPVANIGDLKLGFKVIGLHKLMSISMGNLHF